MHSRRLLLRGWRLILPFFLFLLLFAWVKTPVMAAEEIKLVIDSRVITASPPPVIQNGRTLVPTRLVSETLGANVEWHADSKTVVITKGGRSVKLRIANRLVDFTEGTKTFGLTDVPPKIIADRTFVPLRLVSNALGVSVSWNGAERAVYIDSKVPGVAPSSNITLPSLQPGQAIAGTSELQITSVNTPPAAAEVKFLLLDPETGRGPVIARGNTFNYTYSWLPDPLYNGLRVVAAVVNDKEGRFLAGSVVPVELMVAPKVALVGVSQEQLVSDSVAIKVNLNFLAEYVKYEITNQATGKTFLTGETDPQGSYNWSPQWADNGDTTIKAMAYNRTGQAFASNPVYVSVNVEKKYILKGVSPGATLDKPVTLSLTRNFPVTQVEFLLKNAQTGTEHVLAKTTGSSFKWFPTPEQAGTWVLVSRAKDSEGNIYNTNSITVKVLGTPKLLLETVGPGQVLTGTIKLKSSANLPLSKIAYFLINPNTGEKRLIASGTSSQGEYSWTPATKDAGSWLVQAEGTSATEDKIASVAVPVKVYLGTIYGPKPVIEKSKFLDFVSQLALQSQQKTGMSAALQAAQAILETGWGQYTPVDKYTGRLSYNLFGIKGKGPAGSVTSNTWEEYNGFTFRIDAAFRAYNNPAESWADHKSLLLTASRYEPLRVVMYDSTQGAWALRRTGYATDSMYPLKLVNIIKQYDLHLLDEMGV